MPSERLILMLAALMGAVAVALGALGGHAMQSVLAAQQLATWETATQYLMWHALAGLALALAGQRRLHLPALVLMTGAMLFSGSLYGWLLTGFRPLVFVTPLGGVIMILGWLTLGWRAWRQSGNPNNTPATDRATP